MYCKHCGNEVNDNAVVCIKCGCAIDDHIQHHHASEQKTNQNSKSTLGVIAKVFMIIGCVLSGFYLIPLCWSIPMTVTLCNKLKLNQPIGIGFKICTLLFVSGISGILLLCMPTETKNEPLN